MSDEPPTAPTYRPIAELFTPSASALWATTYNVDIALVNQFLLPRLGQLPLNVTVLADHRTLSRTLARIAPDRADTLAGVNRRWLLRGFRGPGPAFHPKSYLSVASGRATLLVGSGNLSLRGLDEGREVFTTFRSGTSGGDRAIAVWRGWMRRLVHKLGDPLVTARFTDLESRLPAPTAGADDSDAARLVHDLDTGLFDQFATIVGDGPVDELLVASPFHDPGATALARLAEQFAPSRVTVYVGTTTSVEGAALRRAVAGRDAWFRTFDPDEFTHAKLVGVVRGDRGWLLSGSANVSWAGLLAPVRERGNVELGVLVPLPAGLLRDCFTPPRVSVTECDPGLVDGLTSGPDEEEPPSARVRLLRAEAQNDDRLLVVSDPPPEPEWSLTDGERTYPLRAKPDGRMLTIDLVAARLVRLADGEGTAISDAVVVDDPTELAAQLRQGAGAGRRKGPSGLDSADLSTPIGQALAQLDEELVMDAAELVDGPATSSGVPDGSDAARDDDFWDRLTRERLGSDPRASRYPGLARSDRNPDDLDDLLERLRLRLGPGPGPGPAIGIGGASPPPHEPGRAWGSRARRRVRVRNVLRRWATAVADPRLSWVHPSAPVVNFEALVRALSRLTLDAAESPETVELTTPDLDELWWALLAAFCGTGRRDGYLDRLPPAEAGTRVAGLDSRVREDAAWLCWITVRPGVTGRRQRIVRVLPTLAAAVDYGLPVPSEDAIRCAAVALGNTRAPAPTRSGMESNLLEAATFEDDGLWCRTTAEQLGLDELRFEHVRDPHRTRTELHVRGLDDPLSDPRVPRLLLAASRYRDGGIVVRAAPTSGARLPGRPGVDWRLAHVPDEPLGYSVTRAHDMMNSVVDLDSAQLERMTDAGQALTAIFEHG